MTVVGVVLAGGKSTRFGQDKALLEIDRETLLQRTVRSVREVCPDTVVIGPPVRAEQVEGVQVLQDEVPEIGPLGGIYTALRARPGDAALVVAVDMPFLNPALLQFLAEQSTGFDVVLPVVGGRGQQLHAVYGPQCLPYISTQIAEHDYKIDRFFPRVRVRRIEEETLRELDPALESFHNVNTPELWGATLQRLAG